MTASSRHIEWPFRVDERPVLGQRHHLIGQRGVAAVDQRAGDGDGRTRPHRVRRSIKRECGLAGIDVERRAVGGQGLVVGVDELGGQDMPSGGVQIRHRGQRLRHLGSRQAADGLVGRPDRYALPDADAGPTLHGASPDVAVTAHGNHLYEVPSQSMSSGEGLPGVAPAVKGIAAIVQPADALGGTKPFVAAFVNGNALYITGRQAIVGVIGVPGVVSLVAQRAVIVQHAHPTALNGEPDVVLVVHGDIGDDLVSRVKGDEGDPHVVRLGEGGTGIHQRQHLVPAAHPLDAGLVNGQHLGPVPPGQLIGRGKGHRQVVGFGDGCATVVEHGQERDVVVIIAAEPFQVGAINRNGKHLFEFDIARPEGLPGVI